MRHGFGFWRRGVNLQTQKQMAVATQTFRPENVTLLSDEDCQTRLMPTTQPNGMGMLSQVFSEKEEWESFIERNKKPLNELLP